MTVQRNSGQGPQLGPYTAFTFDYLSRDRPESLSASWGWCLALVQEQEALARRIVAIDRWIGGSSTEEDLWQAVDDLFASKQEAAEIAQDIGLAGKTLCAADIAPRGGIVRVYLHPEMLDPGVFATIMASIADAVALAFRVVQGDLPPPLDPDSSIFAARRGEADHAPDNT